VPRRIVLLVTSPRLPAGLLTAAAWDVVRAYPVLTAAESEQARALRAAGVTVTVVEPDPARVQPALAELELMYGSWDPAGARLLDAVAVMDRLVSPGGDPWKRAQDHRTLAPYLLEESYEAYDAIESGDLDELREELGDVLLQIVLHARLAEELPDGRGWNIDDVAGGLVDKMIRRNPHVFAGDPAETLEEITENWDRIKKAEKSRDSALDGIALSQPALALTAKILQRAERAGLAVPLPDGPDPGSALVRLVAETPDAEALLRRAALKYADAVRSAEQKNVGPAE
jgi:XTP/dITP diphosphohydrolase